MVVMNKEHCWPWNGMGRRQVAHHSPLDKEEGVESGWESVVAAAKVVNSVERNASLVFFKVGKNNSKSCKVYTSHYLLNDNM